MVKRLAISIVGSTPTFQKKMGRYSAVTPALSSMIRVQYFSGVVVRSDTPEKSIIATICTAEARVV